MRGRILLSAIVGFPALLFAAAGYRAVELARQGPVPPEWRDLNCDGKVSPIEWLRAGLDYDLRDAENGCRAIYHVKTGRVVVHRCESEPRCRPVR